MTDDHMHALQNQRHREALAVEMAGLRAHAERARWCEEHHAEVIYSDVVELWLVLWTDEDGLFQEVSDPDRDTAIDRAMTEDK